ncbi:tetratricopeptide repeat protein [Undibacterium fentianense]|uniref:LicD family protein n=1 Tax=Undibacterium fentianense TaxID=2828728 RepID=A0A941IE76_9BURK|nr:tetratricopeptide repeat protein [Undibacterium fentianense]MBR7799112.1 LicD family protein [Undibacterium fentianense]
MSTVSQQYDRDLLQMLWQRGDYLRLEETVSQLLKHDGHDTVLWKWLAQSLIRQNKSQAIFEFLANYLLPSNDTAVLEQLGVTYLNHHLFVIAEQLFLQALEHDKTASTVRYNFAVLRQRQCRYPEADHLLHQAILDNPELMPAYFAFGLGLMQQGKAQQSLDFFEKACEVFPSNPTMQLHRADALRANHHVEEAARIYLQLIPMLKDSDHLLLNLGLALKDLGRFAESLHSIRNALRIQFFKLKSDGSQVLVSPKLFIPKTKILDPDLALQALGDVRRCLQDAQIEWCLYAGTLLGIVRDGALIEGDKDLDIAIHYDVDRDRLMQILMARHVFRVLPSRKMNNERPYMSSMSLVHQASKIVIDCFFLRPDGDHHFISGVEHIGQDVLARVRRFEFKQIRWKDASWSVPSEPEQYLQDVYGKDWRKPDPYFDTMISNPGRVQAAIPVVLCYGYAKLCGALSSGDYLRAAAYCRQLLARNQDAILEDIATWCQGQKVMNDA